MNISRFSNLRIHKYFAFCESNIALSFSVLNKEFPDRITNSLAGASCDIACCYHNKSNSVNLTVLRGKRYLLLHRESFHIISSRRD